MRSSHWSVRAFGFCCLAAPALVWAETPQELLAAYAQAARQENVAFTDFSAARGERLFKSRHGAEWSCSSCHTDNPVQAGRHAKTGRPIQPLAPAGNAERFTASAKTEKWFKRNCNDVLSRPCTATEKGDVLTYLMTLRP